ncbi:HTH-type transcriptional regulator KipR [Methylophilaceae bacterium]|nr:HTH-type transcriptional regulator KipR [Methylophilaceae bacterium]
MRNERQGKQEIPAGDLAPGSLNRAVILLKAIAQGSRKGSSLTELVARTALPRPTIHRILDRLMALEWVTRDDETSRFNLGTGLAALGYSAISRNPIEHIAATYLSRLAAKLDQVVYLGIRSGLDMVCIGRYESESQIQVGKGRVGMRAPLGLTPSCMAVLSRLPHHEVQEVIEANLSRYHRIEGFDETGFREAVAYAIQNGYSSYDGIMLDRTTSGLGVPVCDESGYPVAGIATTYITGWLDEAQKKSCLRALQETALRISESLILQGKKPGRQP